MAESPSGVALQVVRVWSHIGEIVTARLAAAMDQAERHGCHPDSIADAVASGIDDHERNAG